MLILSDTRTPLEELTEEQLREEAARLRAELTRTGRAIWIRALIPDGLEPRLPAHHVHG
jgi:hypothetical protein